MAYGAAVTDVDPGGFGAHGPADRPMTLTTARVGAAAVVTVAGELDLHTSRELMAAVDDVLEWPDVTAMVIDLSAVSFIGSSGLGTLADLATRTTAARVSGETQPSQFSLRLVAPPGNYAVIRPWEAMNLQQILPLHPTLAAAVDDR